MNGRVMTAANLLASVFYLYMCAGYWFLGFKLDAEMSGIMALSLSILFGYNANAHAEVYLKSRRERK